MPKIIDTYTIQVKVTKKPYYEKQDFLMFISRAEGFTPMTQLEASILMEIFKNYPKIFTKPLMRVWNEKVWLPDIRDTKKYSRPLTCDYEYLIGDLKKADLKKLNSLDGRIGGFDQKYTADSI